MKKSKQKSKVVKKIPLELIAELSVFFGRDSQTIRRWIKDKSNTRLSDSIQAQEILKKYLY